MAGRARPGNAAGSAGEMDGFDREGRTVRDGVPIRGADGVYRQFLTRVNAVRDGKGKILRWMGVNSNITGQRQAEVLLLERNAQLNAAFRQTYSFMLMLATDGTIV